ncbi:MAG: amidinotransferase [Proteobacteria bacterium]|nr:amidinotransferase [Pseudomonadota bacterium]
MSEAQTAAAVLMVRPARFGYNEQTAASNEFQRRIGEDDSTTQRQALAEFDALTATLRAAGVQVIVAEDTPEPAKPDAVFPNNWVSFHADGTVVLYPMLAPNRRLECREEIIEQVRREGGFRIGRRVDLRAHECERRFLEGTGSLILDRPARQAYACLSPRTDLNVLGEFAQLLDYTLVTFDAAGPGAIPVYHTNVLMALGREFAVLCTEALPDAAQRAAVLSLLRASGRELLEISTRQMERFAGNLLELRGYEPLIALSASAWEALDEPQRALLARHGQVLPARIPTIERLGGGSVRCMLAEIHLPRG